MSMKNFFQKFDSFGTVVGLHFGNWLNKEEGRSPAYKTSAGGILSILYYTIFWGSFIYYALILFGR